MSETKNTNREEDVSALDELKSLLIGQEQQELTQLRERIDDPELRADDIAKVLAEAINLSKSQDESLTAALEAPVGECIKTSVQKNPEVFAESFYPVIAPAIRKSISSALKDLVDSLNQALEHSFTLKGLRWRLESMRSGVSFPEVVLRHTLSYRVEQVLLIKPESGLLVQHISDPQIIEADPDAVSAMLTAIGGFVRTAFLAEGDEQNLDNVDMGDYNLLLFYGPQAYLACAVRGVAPASLRDHCNQVLEKIHRRYHDVLENFDGKRVDEPPVVALLETCLVSEQKETEKSNGYSLPFIFFMLLVFAGIAWLSYDRFNAYQLAQKQQQQFTALTQDLEETPGIFLTEVEQKGSVLRVRGLRDNLAAPVEQKVLEHGLDTQQLDMRFLPYQDMSPEFVRKRLDLWLQPPATVNMIYDDQGSLRLSGWTNKEWLVKAKTLAAVIPGIKVLDTQALQNQDQRLLDKVKSYMDEEPGTTLRVLDGRLYAEGSAPIAWIRALDKLPELIPGLSVAAHKMLASEKLELEQLQEKLHAVNILFTEDVILAVGQAAVIDDLSKNIVRLQQLCVSLKLIPEIEVIGNTDSIGLPAYNYALANARAVSIRDQLIARGMPAALFQIKEATPELPGSWESLEMRRVTFRLKLLTSAKVLP